MAHEVEDRADIAPPAQAVEVKDVNVRAIVKFGVGMAIGIVISMALMAGLAAILGRWAAGGNPVSRYALRPDERLPPHPRQLAAAGTRYKADDFTDDPGIQQQIDERNLNLELRPPEEFRTIYEEIKQLELSSYGLMSKQPGEYRVPIDEAKRLLLERMTTPEGNAPATAPTGAAPADVAPPTAASSGRATERRNY